MAKNANFCHACGFMLKPYCRLCRHELPQASSFCYQCGQQIGEILKTVDLPPETSAQKTPDLPSIASERKLVTILFADLRGFTTMSEKLDAERVTEILNECFRRLGNVITQFEGHIDKFMGDCVMVLFGAPIAKENHHELALDCSLAMMRELEIAKMDFEKRYGTHAALGMGIGINTGIVIAGGFGTKEKFDYTVIGDTVNVAQRLQSVAVAGEVLVSRSVYKLAEGFFEFEPVRSMQLKGKSQAVEAYGLRSRKIKDTHDKTKIDLPPMIGRDRELKLVDRLLSAAFDNFGQILFLAGDPGIGKSRLKSEIRRMSQNMGFHWLEARSSNLTRQTPYAMIIRLLESLMESEFGDSPEAALVQAFVSDRVQDLTSRTLLFELLKISDPTSEALLLDGNQRKRATSNAVKALLLKVNETHALSIYLEDMHWMDISSLELIGQLMDSVPSSRIFLSGSLRPEFQHDWHRKPHFTQITLGHLRSEESLELARFLLQIKDIPQPLQKIIEEKSDGNPLYIEEIIKALIDSGQITRTNEHETWSIKTEIAEVEIPHTLHGLIASRMDRLSDQDKQVLQYASIIGRKFSSKLLKMASGWTKEIDESLERLQSKSFVFETSSTFDEIIYTFKHALTQDVAYSSIISKLRRGYHERVVIAFEELLASKPESQREEFYEALAHHAEEAHLYKKTVFYLKMNATRLSKNFANEAAIRDYAKTISLLETGPDAKDTTFAELAELCLKISEIYLLIGDLVSAENYQRKPLASAEENSEYSYLCKAYRRLGEISRTRGDLDKAAKLLYESLNYAIQAEDYESQIRTYKSLANTLSQQNQVDKAYEIFKQGVEAARHLGQGKLTAEYLNDMAALLFRQNKSAEAKILLEECSTMTAKDPSLRSIFVSATLNLGVVAYLENDRKQAIKKFQDAAKVAQEIGDLSNLILAKHNIGEMWIEFSKFVEALQEFEECFKIATEMGNEFERMNNRVLIGYLKTKTGEGEEGIRILEETLEQTSKKKYWDFYCDSHIYLAKYYADHAQIPRALDHIRNAKEKAEELKNQQIIQRCHDELEKLNRISSVPYRRSLPPKFEP